MSTRSLIARKVGGGWEAVYHHWDGYPNGLGDTLYHIYGEVFSKDARRMLAFLLDKHRGGWSTINNADWASKPGFGGKGPQCYCHGERSEGPYDLITSKGKDFGGAEYCYVLDPDTANMAVLERRYADDTKATQFFGVDASDVADGVNWHKLADVDLNGPEPDWKALEG